MPLLFNVILDYKATEEFGRYLEGIEIKEHPFVRRVSVGKHGRKKLEPSDKFWDAKFTLSRIPGTGKLEVCYI